MFSFTRIFLLFLLFVFPSYSAFAELPFPSELCPENQLAPNYFGGSNSFGPKWIDGVFDPDGSARCDAWVNASGYFGQCECNAANGWCNGVRLREIDCGCFDEGCTDPSGPGTGGSDPSDPGTGGSDPSDPGTGGSDPSDPGTGGSDPSDPGTGGSDPSDPGTGGSDPSDPGTGGSDPTDPGTGGSDPLDPGTGDPTDPSDPGESGSDGPGNNLSCPDGYVLEGADCVATLDNESDCPALYTWDADFNECYGPPYDDTVDENPDDPDDAVDPDDTDTEVASVDITNPGDISTPIVESVSSGTFSVVEAVNNASSNNTSAIDNQTNAITNAISSAGQGDSTNLDLTSTNGLLSEANELSRQGNGTLNSIDDTLSESKDTLEGIACVFGSGEECEKTGVFNKDGFPSLDARVQEAQSEYLSDLDTYMTQMSGLFSIQVNQASPFVDDVREIRGVGINFGSSAIADGVQFLPELILLFFSVSAAIVMVRGIV
jgi:hypothetical protein